MSKFYNYLSTKISNHKELELKSKGRLSIRTRLLIGIHKGLITPTLPKHLVDLQNSIPIRLLRFGGVLSTFLVLTQTVNKLGDGYLYIIVLYVCTFFIFAYAFFLVYLNYHRFKHIYKLIKTGELDIYNSPFDRMASIAGRMIMCAKGFCDSAAPVGLFLGIMGSVDEIRKIKGLEPVFLPFLADVLLPNSESSKIYNENRKLAAQLTKYRLESKAMAQEMGIINNLVENKIITLQEANQWREDISKNSSLLTQNTNSIKDNIKYNLEKIHELQKNRK